MFPGRVRGSFAGKLAWLLLAVAMVPPATAQVATTVTKKAYDAAGVEVTKVHTGDTIRYVIQPHLPLSSAGPTTPAEMRDTMTGSQTYVSGSLRGATNWILPTTDPSGVFSNTLIATWTPPTIPATSNSTMVPVFGENAYEARLPVLGNLNNITVSGSGDGYAPFAFKMPNGHQAVMTINHHQTFASILCADINLGGASCIGSPNIGLKYVPHAFGFAKVGTKIFYPAMSATTAQAGIGCIDVSGNTTQNCATEITEFPGATLPSGEYVMGVVNVAGKVCMAWKPAAANEIRVGCVDPMMQTVVSNEAITMPTQALDINPSAGLPGPNFVQLDGNRWVVGYRNVSGLAAYACLSMGAGSSPATNCDGSSPATGKDLPSGASGYAVIAPRLDSGGSRTGFCVASSVNNNRNCYGLNGTLSGPAPSALVFPQWSSWYYAVPGTPLLMSFSWNAAAGAAFHCFDWSTGSSCVTPSIPLSGAPNVLNASFSPYGMDRLDSTAGGSCYVTYGHYAEWELWNVTPQGQISEHIYPASNTCNLNFTKPYVATIPDPTPNICGPNTQVIQWKQVLLSGLPIQSGSVLEFLNSADGVIAAAAVPSTSAAGGAVSVDVPAAVDWPTHATFKVRLTLRGVNAPVGVTPLIRVTYATNDDSPPQICLNATVDTCANGNVDNLALLAGGASGSGSVNGSAMMQCEALADLAISKDNAASSLMSGQVATYAIVVTNNGPDAANGAVLRDPAVPGLDCVSPPNAALTCGGETNGAVCPAAPLSIGALQSSGIPIPTLPSGSSVTFTLSCTVQ